MFRRKTKEKLVFLLHFSRLFVPLTLRVEEILAYSYL